MEYIKLLIMIAVIRGTRVVRRIIRPPAEPLDADVVGWINILTTCDDHAVITHYAKVTF